MKNVENIYPLSPMQEGILFHALLSPESDAYIAQAAFTLQGDLNVAALRQSCERVIALHGILRTTFLWENLDKPLQVVRKQVPLQWTELDWRDLNATDAGEELNAWLKKDRERGFSLSKHPPLRLALIRFAEANHKFVCTHHHILMDGWSVRQIFAEVFDSYEALTEGRDAQLKTRRPYSDYIAWLQKQDMTAAEAFWRQALGGIKAPTPLPFESAQSNRTEYDYAQDRVCLPDGSMTQLQQFARKHKLTVNTLVQGAWALLLSRYSGEQRVVFGATAAGRPPDLGDADSMIGLFINTLPVQVTVTPEAQVLPWLEALQGRQVEQRQYEYTPLVTLQEWSDVPRGLPLFENILLYQNFPASYSDRTSSNTNLQVTWTGGFERTHYPLVVTVAPGQELLLKIGYDASRIAAASVKRILGHLQRVLESFVSNPQQQLKDVSILTESETDELVSDWNNTGAEYLLDTCIHKLVETSAAAFPERVAVQFGGERLTYDELNRRANRLAHYLRARGAGPEVLIGICMDRSLQMLVGLLGILKSGAAYVPLDPRYPAERVAFMLADAGVKVLLTEDRLLQELPPHEAITITLDGDWPQIECESDGDVNSSVQPENLAYVIYTSGSTGTPKGVAIAHRSTVALIQWARQVFTADELNGVLASTSICFDLSLFEIFVPLSVAGRVVLAADALQLPAIGESGQVRLVNTVPSAIVELLRIDGIPKSVCTVNLAGEPLKPGVIKELYERGIGTVYDLYGPSEDTTYSTFTRRLGDGPATIGRPIDNTQVYLLDSRRQLVPAGVAGELYLGGEGLARGYLQRPELTAERFVPNPFGNPGSRLYRTGDLSRYLPDANLQYLGRIDNQIKLRGFRIELGEIEAVLSRHPRISQAVAMVREDEPGLKRLVGYVVSKDHHPVDRSDLRRYLRDKLPEYMVPAAFIALPEIPLTPNGKVDRSALPRLDGDGGNEATYVSPRTPIEEMVAEIWAEVMKVSQVGIRDNFFELGGHSLLAIQLVSRIRSALKVELALSALFNFPTVEELSQRIGEQLASAADEPIAAIEPAPRSTQLPLSFAQQRLWFLDQLDPGNLAYNVPRGLVLKGRLDLDALQQSFNALVSRHEILRTSFPSQAGTPVQAIADDFVVALPLIDLHDLPETERLRESELLTRSEWQRPFDLANGPLLRVLLLRLGAEEHILLVSSHHIVNDGWSQGLLLRELAHFYGCFTSGSSPGLTPIAVQYADYAQWQHGAFAGSRLQKQLDYWRQHLAGAPELINLPIDHARTAIRRSQGKAESIRLSKDLLDRLREIAKKERTTLYVILLAAFKLFLSWLTNEGDVIVGAPSAGRSHKETEAMIGHFVNSLVLRTNLTGAQTFGDIVHRVRDIMLQALANQDVPFEKIVEELRLKRTLAYNPLFQVWFVLHQGRAETVALDGLTVEVLPIENSSARHDLQLALVEGKNGLDGAFTYNADLFESATVARMARRFELLLSSIAARVNLSLTDARSLLAEADEADKAMAAQLLEDVARIKLKSIRRKTITGPEIAASAEVPANQQ